MKPLLIAGLSGFALEASTMFREAGQFGPIGLLAAAGAEDSTAYGLPIVGSDDDLVSLRKAYSHCFVAIGEPRVRRRVSEKLVELGYELVSIVHRTAYVSPDVAIAPGTVIYPHATVMAGCTLGRSCLINTNVSIGHECVLGSYINVSPGANVAGRVEIGDDAYVGIGAMVLETRRIGSGATIGGGAVVTKDVAAGVTVVGIPARPRT